MSKDLIVEPNLDLINSVVKNLEKKDLSKLQPLIKKMIEEYPNGSTTFLFVGIYFNLIGNTDRARDNILKCLEINPNYGEAHRVYADILRRMKDFDKSLNHALLAVKINQKSAPANDTLGSSYAALNNNTEAENCFKKAILLNPNFAEVYNNLGNTQRHLGKFKESIQSLKKAIELAPQYIEIYSNLALTYFKNRNYEDAIGILDESFKRGNLHNKGNLVDVYTNYGHIYSHTHNYKLSKEYYEKAININENFSSANNGLGEVLAAMRKPEEALKSFEKSLVNSPKVHESYSNLLFCKSSLCKLEQKDRYETALKFQELEKIEKVKLKINKSTDRKLKLGFISADFFEHPVGYFLANPLKFINDKNFETIAFNNCDHSDAHTKKLKKMFTKWHDIFYLPDEEIVEMITALEIDILIDLSGHTSGNNMRVLRHKPAPIQVTWLGYCSTTGISEMDYIICDNISLPQRDEKWFVEKPLRMERSYYCFSDPVDKEIKIDETISSKDYINFGCFNNVKKLNDEVLNVWSEILRQSSESYLYLKSKYYKDQSIKQDIQDHFSENGVNKERIKFLEQSPREEYLKGYNLIDISLDPFPYPGGTTTCESLYMGTPVISMNGNDFLSRNGENILRNCGLEDFIAKNNNDYIKKAIKLSKDEDLRNKHKIREIFLSSPLMDGEGFSRELKSKLRKIWESYIKSL